jgi:hypothetical protein
MLPIQKLVLLSWLPYPALRLNNQFIHGFLYTFDPKFFIWADEEYGTG